MCTIGPTAELKVSFQFSLGECGHGLTDQGRVKQGYEGGERGVCNNCQELAEI